METLFPLSSFRYLPSCCGHHHCYCCGRIACGLRHRTVEKAEIWQITTLPGLLGLLFLMRLEWRFSWSSYCLHQWLTWVLTCWGYWQKSKIPEIHHWIGLVLSSGFSFVCFLFNFSTLLLQFPFQSPLRFLCFLWRVLVAFYALPSYPDLELKWLNFKKIYFIIGLKFCNLKSHFYWSTIYIHSNTHVFSTYTFSGFRQIHIPI